MGLEDFTNGLRLLRSIDRHELLAAGLDCMRDDRQWVAFREAPHDWLLRADDTQQAMLWGLMVVRANP